MFMFMFLIWSWSWRFYFSKIQYPPVVSYFIFALWTVLWYPSTNMSCNTKHQWNTAKATSITAKASIKAGRPPIQPVEVRSHEVSFQRAKRSPLRWGIHMHMHPRWSLWWHLSFLFEVSHLKFSKISSLPWLRADNGMAWHGMACHVVGYYVMLEIFSNSLNFRDSKLSIASFDSPY